MARLFRPTFSSIDKETGNDLQRRAKKWYGDYRDADGNRCRVPLSSDKDAAQAQLAEILRTVERQKAGLIDRLTDQLDRPLESSVEEYREQLESRGRAAKHISETIRLIRNVINGTGCVVLKDLQRGEESIEGYLSKRRRTGVSHRTLNADVTAIRSFCRWLVRKKRIAADPTIHVEKLNEEIDRRRERRPLTDEEAKQLVKATLKSERTFRGLNGQDRAMLYMLAQRSGLRRWELVTLLPRSFKLNGNPPTVRVQTGDSKHRKEDLLPLPAETAKELANYFQGKPRSKPIWPGNWWKKSAQMFRADLTSAGISIIDEDGKVLDFHGQRTTFISGLARAGVSPTMAQKLARHSDVNLTMRAYTHLQVEELAGAVERLPSFADSDPFADHVPADKDTELDRVVQAWPQLSSKTRRAIVTLIEGGVR